MELFLGDCLEVMDSLIQQRVKIDAIITDPPYGTTACKWDSVIPFDELWERLNKLIKSNGAIVLFGCEPFSSALRMSNIKNYKYDWVWNKTKRADFIRAKLKPMSAHENIMIFSLGSVASGAHNNMVYYPQGLIEVNKINKNRSAGSRVFLGRNKSNFGPNNKLHNPTYIQKYTGYPCTQLNIASETKTVHPTQKPVALMEYLIKTYTQENELVLDFTMGSGSTGVACKNTNRRFIGIEKEGKYFNIAKERLGDKNE